MLLLLDLDGDRATSKIQHNYTTNAGGEEEGKSCWNEIKSTFPLLLSLLGALAVFQTKGKLLT